MLKSFSQSEFPLKEKDRKNSGTFLTPTSYSETQWVYIVKASNIILIYNRSYTTLII